MIIDYKKGDDDIRHAVCGFGTISFGSGNVKDDQGRDAPSLFVCHNEKHPIGDDVNSVRREKIVISFHNLEGLEVLEEALADVRERLENKKTKGKEMSNDKNKPKPGPKPMTEYDKMKKRLMELKLWLWINDDLKGANLLSDKSPATIAKSSKLTQNWHSTEREYKKLLRKFLEDV